MKNIDYTFIASIITALAAIIAPTITALIHSIKEYQIAKLNNSSKNVSIYANVFLMPILDVNMENMDAAML